MFKDWWRQQIGIKEVCGIEYIFDESSEITCQICSLKLIKNSVSLISQKTHLSLETTIKELKQIRAPLAINFSGLGVLTRIVPNGVSGDEISIAFPGIEQDKFYIQQIIQEKTAVISLINKKTVDTVLKELEGHEILNISLAGLVALNFNISLTDEKLNFARHQLRFNLKELISYNFSKDNDVNDSVNFNQVKLSSVIFNTYLEAFQLFFYPQLNPIGLENWKRELELYYKGYKIKSMGLIFIVSLFITLIINFLTWNQLNRQEKELQNQVIFNQSMVSNRDSLFIDINHKEEKIKRLGILPLSHQFIQYQIIKVVTQGIYLSSIIINPSSEEGLNYGEVIIKGVMKDVNSYKSFKTGLFKIKLFSIINESFGYKENNHSTNFEIRLKLFKFK
jgi:hypothetical protein